jgi:hypothetical protein
MSEFVPELLRLMQSAIRKRSHLANGRKPISILPVRQASPSERLPWEPGRIELTPDERQLLAWLRRELNQELGPEEVISESDVLHFALEQLQLKLRHSNREDIL